MSTETVVAEQLLRQRVTDEVVRADAVFGRFVDDLSDVVLVLTPDAQIVYANKALRSLLGLELGEVTNLNLFDLVPPEATDRITALWERILGLEPGGTYDEDVPFGSAGWVNMAAQTWAGPDGRVALVTSIGRDRTAEYMAKQELEELNQRLADSNRDLQDFAYVASHDLQEPLRKIVAFSDRLEKKYRDALDDQARDYLGRVQNAASRMQRLIEDLLSFSRVNTDGDDFEDTDLGVVVHEVLQDLEVAITESGADVRVDPLPVLAADPSQMRQLFQNLVANAIKFRKSDTAPEIRISAHREGAEWHLVVQDNGIGFDQKYASKIFTVFQRLHGRHEYEGSGVGLSVCRRIAERHHGGLEAQSVPGEGATFTLTIPA